MLRKRYTNNKIHMLQDEDGTMVTDRTLVTTMVVDYYKQLLGTSGECADIDESV